MATLAGIETFKRKITKHLSIQLELVVNENRSTMLSLLKKKQGYARLSMHRMFLDAPEEVISAIAHYVRGTRKAEGNSLLLRRYIQSNLPRFNYAHRIDKEKLITQGTYYDLQKIYEQLNKRYFDNRLDLSITWFGIRRPRKRTRVIFGQYYDHMKLIKIHRMMDSTFFPDYFVHFVVYHEMLHEVVPGHVDRFGIFRTHGKEFKRREKLFEHYERASAWEKEHRTALLK